MTRSNFSVITILPSSMHDSADGAHSIGFRLAEQMLDWKISHDENLFNRPIKQHPNPASEYYTDAASDTATMR